MDKIKISKNLGLKHNVTIRVLDNNTGNIVQEHVGHNMATNSMLTGIGHYLVGDGVLNQGYEMLARYVPRYISLGTMGLLNQSEDSDGLPSGIGVKARSGDDAEYEELLAQYLAAKKRLEEASTAYEKTVCCTCGNLFSDEDPEWDVIEPTSKSPIADIAVADVAVLSIIEKDSKQPIIGTAVIGIVEI